MAAPPLPRRASVLLVVPAALGLAARDGADTTTPTTTTAGAGQARRKAARTGAALRGAALRGAALRGAALRGAALRGAALAGWALALSGCSQCGTGAGAGIGPDAGASAAGSTGAAAPSITAVLTAAPGGDGGCVSPAIEEPPPCPLARASAKSPSFAPDGRTLLVAVVEAGDGGAGTESTEVWDARRGTFVTALVQGLEPHGGLETVWSPDGGRAAVAGVGDSQFGFRIFGTATWNPVSSDADLHYSFPCALAADPAGERVAVTTLLGVAEIHDLRSGRRTASLGAGALRAAGHRCSLLEWSGDGKAIQVEGLRRPEGLRPVLYRSSRTAPPGKPVRDEDLVMARLAPRGDLAAYLDVQGNVRLFAKYGAEPFKVLPAGQGVPPTGDPLNPPVHGVAWQPDAAGLVTWDHTGRLRVWNVAKGTVERELRAGASPLEGPVDPEVEAARLAWAPGGRAFAFWDGLRPELWDVGTGAQRLATGNAPVPEYPTVARMSFRPGGALLAAGRALYDTRTGALARALPAEVVEWLNSGDFALLGAGPGDEGAVRILRISDGAVLVMERLGGGAAPVLLPHTEDGVFQGPRDLAGCALPESAGGPGGAPDAGGDGPGGADAGAGKAPSPEPRDTLLADFWSGRPVARTCPDPGARGR